MKALVYTAPNQMTYRVEPDPQLAPGEVVLRINAVGICGSDMHAFHGRDPRRTPPLVMGHEVAGEIVAGPAVGDRVTVNPLIACGACDYCVQGRTNLCSNRTMVGMTRPGGFAEYMSIPASSLVDIPAGMSATQAALTEPAATALHALNMAMRALYRPLPEVSALVLGGGSIGMLAALLIRAYGCRRLRVGETNPLRRAAVAKHVGCDAFDPRSGGPGENEADLVVDAVGAAATRIAALVNVTPGGVVLHIGLQDWASEIDMRKLTLAEITLIGTYTYTMADMRAAVARIADGSFGDLAWVEERRLHQGQQAFCDLDQGRTASAKIVLLP